MSVTMTSLQSSSDESDVEKPLLSPAPKLFEHTVGNGTGSDMKTFSYNSGDLINISESGSEKESGASRDSDSSASVSCYQLPSRKRKSGDKAGSKRCDNESSPKILARDPQDTSIQEDSCSKLAKRGKFVKCRECFKSPETNRYSCRFYSFRKMWRSKKNHLYAEGFCGPEDADQEDRNLWLPQGLGFHLDGPTRFPTKEDLDFHVARFILSQVGDQFCSLMHQEADATNLHMGDDDSFIAWKKPMRGVREMCDVCKTTLFNFHWACGRCGFAVCIDCYKARKNGLKKAWMVEGKDMDEWKWLRCTNMQAHEQKTLMLCQIIAADCLERLGQLVHDVRELYGIPQNCNCKRSTSSPSILSTNKEQVKKLIICDPLNAIISHLEGQPSTANDSKEHEARLVSQAEKQPLPEDSIELSSPIKQEGSDSDSDEEVVKKQGQRENGIRALLSSIKPNEVSSLTHSNHSTPKVTEPHSSKKLAQISSCSVVGAQPTQSSSSPSKSKSAHTLKNSVTKKCIQSLSDGAQETPEVCVMQHFVRRNKGLGCVNRNQPPPRTLTAGQSEKLYPGVPHSWLCEGMLLRLIDPSHSGNYKLFQEQWKRGQPVIVGNMTRLLNMEIWHPNSFCRDFGEERNDLVNCATGHLVPNRPMKEFWEGFENFSKRLKDEHGQPMLLKLKDWPPGEDFADMLPERFDDLMQALPLAEYTKRTGHLNLASCLPEFFVRPDLGPKMYNAYGSALFPTKGTTNLHLDISDAVNFMVYVGIPSDSDYDQHIQEAYRAIDEAGCDDMTRRRVRLKEEMPGALWHIYHASDADKIRDLLNKVALERGVRPEPHHDPIHDQSWYLDAELRQRLNKEYGVSGYAIVQCLGDAVFIPAGAPHQVRNLHNCVKVAEDFVSPENVSHCFHLTQEFRDLSDTHTNHEDKLQIKNIIYHTIKSAVSTLLKVADLDPFLDQSIQPTTETDIVPS